MWWKQFSGLAYREIIRFLTVPFETIASPAITSTLYLLIFGIGIGDIIDVGEHSSYLAYLIPGLCTLGLVTSAYENSSSSITIGKYVNELQDLKVAPLSRTQIILSIGVASMVRGVLNASVTFCIGQLFYWHQHGTFIPIANPLLLITYTLLGAFTFGLFGLCVAFYASSFDKISAISSFILTPLIYLGGVFVSPDRLAPAWQYVSYINPLYYLISGIRTSMLGTGKLEWPLVLALLGVFAFVFYVIGTVVTRKGVNYVRQ